LCGIARRAALRREALTMSCAVRRERGIFGEPVAMLGAGAAGAAAGGVCRPCQARRGAASRGDPESIDPRGATGPAGTARGMRPLLQAVIGVGTVPI